MTEAWLSQLAPDRAPPPLSWWPLAPGWWVLAGLMAIGVAAAVWWRRQQRRPSARRWQRAALVELAQVQAQADGTRGGRNAAIDGLDDAALASRLQLLLRRYAVARYGRATVASLSGQPWIDFVVAHGGADWSGEAGRDLLRCAYGSAGVDQPSGMSAAHRTLWIRGARAFLKAGG